VRPAPLSRDRFASAVRSALRDLHRPDRLQQCELAGSRLAVDAGGASPARLRDSLVAAVERVGAEPKAEGLPFSTYRRHHDRALERLTDILWAAEIGEIRLDAAPA
jgi:hypothetical protein